MTGNIFVISAPSGAGKSSLVKALCELDTKLKISISHTTRKIRAGEVDGIDYYFINKKNFEEMIFNNEFLEYAEVYGNYYGTNIDTINEFIDNGNDIILEIDWQGAQQVKILMPNVIMIFIKPPSLEELKNRLIRRNTDSSAVIEKRLASVKEDLSHAHKFDYVIVNDQFDNALQEIYAIVSEYRNS